MALKLSEKIEAAKRRREEEEGRRSHATLEQGLADTRRISQGMRATGASEDEVNEVVKSRLQIIRDRLTSN